MRVAMMGAALVLAGVLAGGTAAAPRDARSLCEGEGCEAVKGKRVCVKKPPARRSLEARPLQRRDRQNAAISFDVAVVVREGRCCAASRSPSSTRRAIRVAARWRSASRSGRTRCTPNAKGHVHTSVELRPRRTPGAGRSRSTRPSTPSGRATGTLTDTESLNANGQTYAARRARSPGRPGPARRRVAVAPPPEAGPLPRHDLAGRVGRLRPRLERRRPLRPGVSVVEVDETCSPGQVSVALYNLSFGTSPMLVDGHGRMHFVYQQVPRVVARPDGATSPSTRRSTPPATPSARSTDHQVVDEDTGTLTLRLRPGQLERATPVGVAPARRSAGASPR